MSEQQSSLAGLLSQVLAEQIKQTAILERMATQQAQLIDVGEAPVKAATDEEAPVEVVNELKSGIFSGRFVPSSEQSAAMRTVAGLVDAGAIELIDDVYLPGGRVFRPLTIKAVELSRRGM